MIKWTIIFTAVFFVIACGDEGREKAEPATFHFLQETIKHWSEVAIEWATIGIILIPISLAAFFIVRSYIPIPASAIKDFFPAIGCGLLATIVLSSALLFISNNLQIFFFVGGFGLLAATFLLFRANWKKFKAKAEEVIESAERATGIDLNPFDEETDRIERPAKYDHG